MAILMVDDDQELCASMQEFLGRDGLDLKVEASGPSGLQRMISEPFDLVVLDVMLPGLDGLEVLRQARRITAVPVILLTARGGSDDRLVGFEAGADDYLSKPFVPAELLARIRAVLRRAVGGAPPTRGEIVAGPLRLQPAARAAWQDDRRLDLTATEFDILEMLARNAGRAVHRDQIFENLYHRPPAPFERAVDMHVSNLRRKLGDDGEHLLRTIRGAGYFLSIEPQG